MEGRPRLNVFSTRATICGGIGAPPPPTDTRLDVSNSAKRGDSSMSQLCVGTPTNEVTRSRSISSSARTGSHRYMITSFTPDEKHPSITGIRPVTWNNGTTRMRVGVAAAALASLASVAARGGGLAGALDRGPAAEAHQRLDDAAVGRHCALGPAGRARRVEDRGVVLGTGGLVGERLAQREDVLPTV